jgi:hypothetical protein
MTELMTRGSCLHYSQLVASSIIELMIRYSWSVIQRAHTKELMLRDVCDTESSYQRAHVSWSGTQRAHTKELMFHDPGHRAHIKELMFHDPGLRAHIVELESMSSSCSTPEILPLLPESYHTIPFHHRAYPTLPYPTIPYHTIPYHTVPYRTVPYRTVPYSTVPYYTISYHTIPYHTLWMYNDYLTLLLCSQVYHIILYYCITIAIFYCCVAKYTISYCTTV